MSENLEKKVLIQVDIANQDAQTKMSALQTAILDLSSATEALKSVTQAAKDNTSAYSDKIAQSKLNVQQMREETVRLNETRKQEAIAIKNAKDATVAASGSYKEAQQSLTKLGNAIKSAKDGFSATSPVIKAQIKEYNELNTKLKEFDKTMGNHQREVGSYKEALGGIEGMLRKLIPGYGEFSEVLKTATSGFNAMGKSASDAEVSMEAAEGAASGLGAAVLVVAAAIAVEGSYLLSFETYADRASQAMAGLKAASVSFLNSINTGGGWLAASLAVSTYGASLAYMAKDAKKAYDQAYEAQGKILELNRQVLISGALSEEENAKIRKDMLVIRNIRADEVTVEKAYQDALKLTNQQYDRNITNQNNLHKALVDKAISAFKLNKEEVAGLKDVEHGYANILKLAHELTATDKLQAAALEELIASAHKGIEIQGTKDVKEQMIQNREDQKLARLEKAHQAELSREQKEAAELAKIKQETESANSERLASIVRTLDFQRQAFAKELSDTDEHYRQLIFKQRKFIEDMEVVVNSKKSTPKEKAAARLGIKAGNNTIVTLTKEQSAAQQSLLEEHSKKILDLSQKAANDLSTLQISAIKDAEEREKQTENLQYKEKQQATQKQITQFNQDKNRLNNEIKTATGERLTILKKELESTQTMIDVAHDKQSEEQIQHNLKLKRIAQDFANQQKLLQDQADIIKTDRFGSSPSKKNNYAAQQKELDDNHNINLKKLTDAEITANEFLKIDEQYISDSNALKHKAAQDQMQFEISIAQQVSSASFNILEQSLRREQQANDAYLQRQKEHDLSNQSLTETQKYKVNEKYRILEGKAKVKAFKQEQELSIAKAVVNGGLAVVKTMSDVGWPAAIPFIALTVATTALEIATIAKQKPPAYAQGGLHYTSDGRGGVLPGYSKTDNTNAYLRSGEAVVVSEAMRDPWARNLVSAINTSYGGRSFDGAIPVNSWVRPGFAAGGVFNTYLPVGDNGLRPNISIGMGRLHPDDIGNIVTGFSQAISQMPRPVTDIKDIAYQQGRYSAVYDRLNY